MPRIAHYVSSTHWDREWYEAFQGYRMRLVAMLDEVLALMDTDPAYQFTMDAQVLPIFDYLEIRPERRAEVTARIRAGRLHVGPWYDLPDEWLVAGESLIRNLQIGMQLARELGGTSQAAAVVDLFGHTGQLPQIFAQLGSPGTVIWRGTHEQSHHGTWIWQAPDGTRLPAFRFARIGYVSFWKFVRRPAMLNGPVDEEIFVTELVKYTLHEAQRSAVGPILLYDGADHIEIEENISALIARANAQLAAHDIRIEHSGLDAYLNELKPHAGQLTRTLTGELRETGRDPMSVDEQALLPGVLSSRIPLKQKNAACEDELTLWAEPFSAFAAGAKTGLEYPRGFLLTAWRHLLENHPHDSICGCSIDQVHTDMLYRFDQSLGIATRLTDRALRTIAAAAMPLPVDDKTLVVTVFNPTATALDEMVDLTISLPEDWDKKYADGSNFETKYAFRITTADGREIPWQTIRQYTQEGFRIRRKHFPSPDQRHHVSVTLPLAIPALGYTTLLVQPTEPPVRCLGRMMPNARTLENAHLCVTVASNGTLTLTDKRTGHTFSNLLTFEDCADIGDGWNHGVALNDQIYNSSAAGADIAVLADGLHQATLRLTVTMHVPEEFDFRLMCRSPRLVPLRITSDITLRRDADHIEVVTTVDNTVRDHRVRVMLPTQLVADTYTADAAFDAVTRPIALAADNATRREFDVETRPQQTWTALTDGTVGLALVTRGLPESAVLDTPEHAIALTLLRGFRRAVFQGLDRNPGGQVLGVHTFRYRIVPFAGAVPTLNLFWLGQRILHPVRQVDATLWDRQHVRPPTGTLPPTSSFLSVTGPAVVSSVQHDGQRLLVRIFNPTASAGPVTLTLATPVTHAECLTLDGAVDTTVPVTAQGNQVVCDLRAKRIATLALRM
ncbi:MAG: glycoside hydrolase family 38 C-terminal domain-containing protein [Phycisphaerae bacterium]